MADCLSGWNATVNAADFLGEWNGLFEQIPDNAIGKGELPIGTAQSVIVMRYQRSDKVNRLGRFPEIANLRGTPPEVFGQ